MFQKHERRAGDAAARQAMSVERTDPATLRPATQFEFNFAGPSAAKQSALTHARLRELLHYDPGNARKRRNSTNLFKGIKKNYRGKKWRAHIRADGRRYHLGSFDTPEAAHAAYWSAAQYYFKEFARKS